MVRHMNRFVRGALWGILALAIAAGAVGVRRHVYVAQRALTPDGSVPFTLESALAYRRIQLAYRDGCLPDRDLAIGWPEGIPTRETDSSGAELALAAAARAWPGTMPLAEKIRWLEVDIPQFAAFVDPPLLNVAVVIDNIALDSPDKPMPLVIELPFFVDATLKLVEATI